MAIGHLAVPSTLFFKHLLNSWTQSPTRNEVAPTTQLLVLCNTSDDAVVKSCRKPKNTKALSVKDSLMSSWPHHTEDKRCQ